MNASVRVMWFVEFLIRGQLLAKFYQFLLGLNFEVFYFLK